MDSKVPATSGTAAYAPITCATSRSGTGDRPGELFSRTTRRSWEVSWAPTGTSRASAR